MTWLAPLGFLGLLGIVMLIIIYIIKPNYQQKLISSTFVWRLSLKYKKKRIPVSKISNFLIFLCQLLTLAICGTLLARPVIAAEKTGDDSERIIIIDTSASMLVKNNNQTRFERAVTGARELVVETMENGGTVSIILADGSRKFAVQRNSSDKMDETLEVLDGILASSDSCGYGSADMETAVALSEEVLRYNPEAQVYLYTATNYLDKKGINVVNVAEEGEWNASILSAKAEMNKDNHYEISIDVGCYGRTEALTVYCDIHSANSKKGQPVSLSRTESFDPLEEERTITFTTDDILGSTLASALYSFDYLEIYVAVDDSFDKDNSFFLYGGTKPTIRIQYASSIPNNFFAGAVRTLRQQMKDKWNVEFKQLKADQKAETEGFDFYIFEHRMPDVMPTDGLVLLVDPAGYPDGLGIQFGNRLAVDSSSTLATGEESELMNFVDPNRITIAKYTQIQSADGSFKELAYYNGSPVILAKNDGDAKVVVWAFDLHYSNLPAMPEFPFLMYNMFTEFFPPTLERESFEVGDTVNITERGENLSLNNEPLDFEGNSTSFVAKEPGVYTVTQESMKEGAPLIIDNFFVKVSSYESNITKQVDSLPEADVDTETRIEHQDLLFYFAIALVALLFIEWALQSKKNY